MIQFKSEFNLWFQKGMTFTRCEYDIMHELIDG